jgi:hypothetical protein
MDVTGTACANGPAQARKNARRWRGVRRSCPALPMSRYEGWGWLGLSSEWLAGSHARGCVMMRRWLGPSLQPVRRVDFQFRAREPLATLGANQLT